MNINQLSKEQLAAHLDGREYPLALTQREQAEAKSAGLVVVFGASDDLAEFRGAIHEEVDCYDGGEILQAMGTGGRKIEAVWNEGDVSWQYRTDIPHATFRIMEGESVYCIGIVFDLKELPE